MNGVEDYLVVGPNGGGALVMKREDVMSIIVPRKRDAKWRMTFSFLLPFFLKKTRENNHKIKIY